MNSPCVPLTLMKTLSLHHVITPVNHMRRVDTTADDVTIVSNSAPRHAENTKYYIIIVLL